MFNVGDVCHWVGTLPERAFVLLFLHILRSMSLWKPAILANGNMRWRALPNLPYQVLRGVSIRPSMDELTTSNRSRMEVPTDIVGQAGAHDIHGKVGDHCSILSLCLLLVNTSKFLG
ncbi:hypothetical protein SAY86_019608 [Trapa natans]|uniref:Uncharacterized protein n=1 Tax=Trapa natans TaxID=22666 RepID=A0AAN7LNG3_TRANT|nr:hypothetical protein SAY86_019608 [Trapa natans]